MLIGIGQSLTSLGLTDFMAVPRYYCYVLTDEILQRHLPEGGKLPGATAEAISSLMADADVLYRAQGCRVLTVGGPRWCIALAYTGPYDGLPITPPPEETYRQLKEVLGTDKSPMWMRESNC
jgi:hypothetical protein